MLRHLLVWGCCVDWQPGCLKCTGVYVVCGFATAQLPPRVYASLLYAPAYIAWKVWLFIGELPRRTGPPWLKTSREA